MAKKGQSKTRFALDAGETAQPNASNELPPGVALEVFPSILAITFADQPGIRYDVRELVKLGGLAQPAAKSIARVLSSMKAGSSRRTKYKDFKYGYLKFIDELDYPPSDLGNLTQAHVGDFITWLGSTRSARDGEPLTKGNRIHKLGCLKEMLRRLSRDDAAIDVSLLVPPNPWATELCRRSATEPLTTEQLRSLVQHVENALQPIIDWADKTFPASPREGNSHASSVAEAWEVLQHIVDGRGYVPQKHELRSDVSISGYLRDPAFLDHLVALAGPNSRQAHLAYTYLLIFTAFNEQPLRDVALCNIEIEAVMGFKRVLFAAEKNRSLGTVRRVFHDDPEDRLSVFRVVDVMKRWTSLLRAIAPAEMQDKLFLFLPRNRTSAYPVGTFSDVDTMGSTVFRNCMSTLSKELGDKYIGPRSIRASGAQIIDDITNGDLPVVAIAMGHETIVTTNNSYRSSAMRDRDQMKLAGVMLHRERYLASNGKVDPRGVRGMIETTGATPGWVCIDNLSSPIPGQRDGFPCTAYPECPACPHAQPHPNQSYFLARAVQLFGKIQDAVARQGPKAALARYGHLLPYLAAGRERIRSTEIQSQAAMMKLSPLPDLD
ncbi:hypothetical protein [Luteimonas sp. YGD11-2]|uniref:hypothetical protein n=1 Tax=Luteimonas sp. YGD11-2 TaxID=2508168 RepID=UPI00100B5F1D|nr:hypothetical protein [Luteimonas sp. YGD11-2]